MSLSKSSSLDSDKVVSEIWKQAKQDVEDQTLDHFSEQTIQRLMTVAIKLFVAKVEVEDRMFSPILEGEDTLTATEAVSAVSEILRATDLNPFDLAIWFNRHPSGSDSV